MLILAGAERLRTGGRFTTARIIAISSKQRNRPNGVRCQSMKRSVVCDEKDEQIFRHPSGVRTTKHKPPSAFLNGASRECAPRVSGRCASCIRESLRSRGCVCRPRSIPRLRARVWSARAARKWHELWRLFWLIRRSGRAWQDRF